MCCQGERGKQLVKITIYFAIAGDGKRTEACIRIGEREGAAGCGQTICSRERRNLRRKGGGWVWRVWVVYGIGGRAFICGAVGVLAASAYVGKWCV